VPEISTSLLSVGRRKRSVTRAPSGSSGSVDTAALARLSRVMNPRTGPSCTSTCTGTRHGVPRVAGEVKGGLRVPIEGSSGSLVEPGGGLQPGERAVVERAPENGAPPARIRAPQNPARCLPNCPASVRFLRSASGSPTLRTFFARKDGRP
jgi:multidrug efflux pump subunit AcrA (membrane-fusion protein)